MRPNEPDLSAWLADLKAKDRAVASEHPQQPLSLRGAAVRGRRSVAWQPEATATDADGRFRITGLGRERLVELRIEGPTIATVEMQVVTRAMPTLTRPGEPREQPVREPDIYYGAAFDFAAEPTQPFEGVVTDRETGKPVAGVTVRGRCEVVRVRP